MSEHPFFNQDELLIRNAAASHISTLNDIADSFAHIDKYDRVHDYRNRANEIKLALERTDHFTRVTTRESQ